jgi:hypothetical protein
MKPKKSPMDDGSVPKPADDSTFPLDVLPGRVAMMVKAIHDVHGVPAAMSATIALSMLSASLGKGLLIMGARGRQTMGNLFALISAPTGAGKSTAINILRKPLDMIADYMQESEDMQCEPKPTPSQLAEQDEEPHGDLDLLPPPAAEVSHLPPAGSKLRRLVCSDTTGAALAILLRQNLETILVATPEAGPQLEEASKPRSLFGQLLLKGYSGDSAEIDRATKSPVLLKQPCIAVCWLCQPHRVNKFYGSPQLLEDGLIARFLFVQINSGMAFMPEEDRRIPVSVINGYAAMMSELYDAYGGRDEEAKIVQASPGVYDIMRNYHNDCTTRWNESDSSLRFCIPRWPEQAWKIMLVLHAVEHGGKSHCSLVDPLTAERAITLMRWYESEQSRVMGCAATRPQDIRLKRLLELLGSAPNQTITLRDLDNSHGFAENEVNELVKMAPLRLKLEIRKPPKSGRRSPRIVLIGRPT